MAKNVFRTAADQLAALTARRAETAAQLEQQRRQAPEAVLAELDGQLAQAQAAAVSEAEAAGVARVAELRQTLKAAGEALGREAEALADKYDALLAAEWEIASLGGYSDGLHAPNLGNLRGLLNDWRSRQREAAEHAERARDPQAQLVAQLRQHLDRALSRYNDALARRGIYAGIDTRQNINPVLNDLQAAMNQDACALLRLTGKWPGGLPIARPKEPTLDPLTGQEPAKGTRAYADMLDAREP